MFPTDYGLASYRVEYAVPIISKAGFPMGGYAAISTSGAEPIDIAIDEFLRGVPLRHDTVWLTLPDTPEAIAYHIAFVEPIVASVRLVFDGREQREALEEIVRSGILTISRSREPEISFTNGFVIDSVPTDGLKAWLAGTSQP